MGGCHRMPVPEAADRRATGAWPDHRLINPIPPSAMAATKKATQIFSRRRSGVELTEHLVYGVYD